MVVARRRYRGNSRTLVIIAKDMGYLHEADSWIEDVLEKFAASLEHVGSEEDVEELFQSTKRILKEKLLESYHNGKGSRSFVKKSAEGIKKGFSRYRKSNKPRS